MFLGQGDLGFEWRYWDFEDDLNTPSIIASFRWVTEVFLEMSPYELRNFTQVSRLKIIFMMWSDSDYGF